MRRLFAAILLATLALSAGAPATCAGWEAAATGRMACCKRAQHASCHDQIAADDCCARHEQSRQSGRTIDAALQAAPTHVLAVLPFAFDTTAAPQITANPFARSAARHLHGPPGLLAPPLRL
jgi:hypothetical protein